MLNLPFQHSKGLDQEIYWLLSPYESLEQVQGKADLVWDPSPKVGFLGKFGLTFVRFETCVSVLPTYVLSLGLYFRQSLGCGFTIKWEWSVHCLYVRGLEFGFRNWYMM